MLTVGFLISIYNMLLHFLIEIEYGKYTSVVRSEIEKTLIKKKKNQSFAKNKFVVS